MDNRIRMIAARLRALREDLGYSIETMAQATDVSVDEYTRIEQGETDIAFSFLFRAANFLNLDLTVLLTGEPARLHGYSIVRKGEGLPIDRRRGFSYRHLAYQFKDRKIEPFLVTAPYDVGAESAEIALNSHAGQEMDMIVSGNLRIQVGDHTELLSEGDSILYDSGVPHGMVAVDGMPCQFLAIVIK